MKHYFTNDPERTINRKNISFRFSTILESFVSHDGVFSKDTLDFGSRVLLETLMNQQIDGDVLDLGCGIGYIGILLKKYKPQINLTMSDVNRTAVELAEINSYNYRQANTCVVSDSFENLSQSFDVIVSNPPIRTGKQNIYKMFAEAYAHLKENGKLYLVIRVKQGAKSACDYLATLGGSVSVIEKENGYWIILLEK